ncbi:hypothetical protein HY029_05520 [Candidatus Gottesmanbacteria bacterium]|nr:hypothetical protein [Candidatus Gottesmanbacteria bacterium]
MKRKNTHRIILAVILIALGVAFRTIWHLGDNVEFVTTASLLAGSYLGFGFSIAVPFFVMFISDLIIGNTNIFIFTWSAYLLIGYFGYLSHLKDLKGRSKVLEAGKLGIIASLWFYFWTNFGVWFLDSRGMYPKTFIGLLESYWYGLPFLKFTLLGNLLFVPVSFFIVEKLKNLNIGLFKNFAV